LQLISQNQIVDNTWTPSFFETDGTGSVRQLTSAAGVPTDAYEFDAFGKEINSAGTTPNNYLYRGEQWGTLIKAERTSVKPRAGHPPSCPRVLGATRKAGGGRTAR